MQKLTLILRRLFILAFCFNPKLVNASVTSLGDQIFSAKDHKFKVEVLTTQRDVIWGFDFIATDQIVFTERASALKVLNLKTKKATNISGAPAVFAKGQGGLLDVAVHPTEPNQIYLTYAAPAEGGTASTALGVGTIKDEKLMGFKQIFKATDANSNKIHFGSRVVFDGSGHLFLSIGDRNEREKAQSLNFHNGKILRLNLDGTPAKENPFASVKGALPEIWSLGHRNPQGLFFDSQSNTLWEAEFGPRGGDELNLIQAGSNYGWPIVTWGREYWGPSIGVKNKKGFVDPVTHWVPSISPSGMMVYRSTSFTKWAGNIFLTNLSGTHLRRLKLENNQVVEQEELLANKGIRFRQVKTGPDGAIYFSTDAGELARLIAVN
jgi:glucose/arabinose dehydrogenase